IDSGILLLHYSEDKTASESDQAVLSSGFMSAIRDFSKETRAEVVDSLSTETEYILFVSNPESGLVTVGVFDRRASQRVARETLEKAQDIVEEFDIPRTGVQLELELKEKFRRRIENLSAQLFGTEYLDAYINDVLANRTDISLAFLLDSEKKEVVAQFARPKPLFREDQVREFLLAHSTLLRTLSKLGVDESYNYFTLQSSGYALASCWSGTLLSVTSGAMRTSKGDVLDAAATVCYHTSAESLAALSSNPITLSRAALKSDGEFIHEEGTDFPSASAVFISTLVNNLDGFFKSVTRRSFERFEVITKVKPAKELRLSRTSPDELSIEILQHV
ncbi:MAG: hypothetical protein ACW96N_06420, partial [Candidatus Thorarchaeota archaeon]